MICGNYFYFLFTILIFSYEVKADCQLTKEQIESETRIFALKPNSNYEVLLEDVVSTGTTLHMICSSTNVATTDCQSDGSFSTPLPINSCTSPIKASVELISDPLCSNQAYRVGYKVDNDFLELYRSCYIKTSVQAEWTKHRTTFYSVTTNRPEQGFTQDGVITGAEADTFKAKSIYDRFELLLGPQQTYITSSRVIAMDRGHLAPSADFAFVDQMRATFKYVNVVPQFSSINRGNWKTIETWVRTLPEAFVKTGATGILELTDKSGTLVPMYLGANNKNPIPKWVYKEVNHDTTTTVFVTYNNIYDSNVPTPICPVVDCPIELTNTKESGFTYCCSSLSL